VYACCEGGGEREEGGPSECMHLHVCGCVWVCVGVRTCMTGLPTCPLLVPPPHLHSFAAARPSSAPAARSAPI